MEKNIQSQQASKISSEFVIDTLRSIRDTTINELLKSDDYLLSFLEVHYNTLAVSPLKLKFLKRELHEILKSSLDLVHYSSLIKEILETGNLGSREVHPLFQYELKLIFQKYGIERPQ